MGRLQRKKTPGKKKKSKQRVDGAELSQLKNTGGEEKVIPFISFSKETKKNQVSSQKKSTDSGLYAGKRLRIKYLDKGLQFLREVKVELKKVTWPTRKQTMGSTVVVIFLVILVSIFLGLVDVGLSNIVRLILH